MSHPQSECNNHPVLLSTTKPLESGEVKSAKHSTALPRRNGRKWSLKDIDIGKKLGEGCFGSVYLAREKESRFVIALKKRIYLMLEYAPKGELSKELTRFRQFNNSRAATYVYQLSNAIAYCHQNDVIHRDIKPENILLCSRGEVKIADFGSAVHRPASRRNAPFGTLDYLAPEVMDPESSYEHSVDTWSLGVLTYEMLNGCVPFVGDSNAEVAARIQSCEFLLPDSVSSDAGDLICSMLRKTPELRIPLADVPSHPWLRHHAEFSLVRCTAALRDWEDPSTHCSQSSGCCSFYFTDPSSSETSSTVDVTAQPDHLS
ncbi:hypothetical protein P879_09844 [Paragonimus westermani]|uniref:Aurora kinase n=1 Tax=Paragonimus westermani TaxID=34504 RepID=A0A8T0DIA1_9TREM|nr:hypothetical protein P879_09844 [Paragonimus westermani]